MTTKQTTPAAPTLHGTREQHTADAAAPVQTAPSSFRDRRAQQVAINRGRRALLLEAAPHADSAFITAIAAADHFWGVDQSWRTAVEHSPQLAAKTPSEKPTANSGAQPSDEPDDETDGKEKPKPRKSRRRPRLFRRRKVSPSELLESEAGESELEPAVTEPDPKPAAPFAVPKPGRRIRAGRISSWIVRTALITGPLVLIGGLAYSCGVQAGSERVAAPPVITADEATAFHLSTFPAEQAAAFGVSYLTTCLTHPEPGDDEARDSRLATLAQATSSGVTQGCGWDGTGPATSPIAVVWNGTQTRVAASVYSTGIAAQLDFTVTLAGGEQIGLGLPIWAVSTKGGSFRVVGEPAFIPVTVAPAAPAPQPGTPDSSLTKTLPQQVLLPFLQAWAASDQVQLNLVLLNTATPAARAGMHGQLTDPVIAATQVTVRKGDPKAYVDGDRVTAQLIVDWAINGSTQRTGYLVHLERTAGRWLVKDITGSQLDAAGGAAK